MERFEFAERVPPFIGDGGELLDLGRVDCRFPVSVVDSAVVCAIWDYPCLRRSISMPRHTR